MRVAVSDANTELLELIDAVERGEEVIVTGKSGTDIKLVVVEKPRFKLGILDHVLTAEGMPDFFEPMDEEELRLWEGRDRPRPTSSTRMCGPGG